MRIMLVTDAWDPQVNGVVRTMKRVIQETEAMGHVWEIVHPGQGFRTMPLPTYPEINWPCSPGAGLKIGSTNSSLTLSISLPKAPSAWPGAPCASW